MTERTMRGLLRSAAACAPLLVLVPSLAWAQTQAIDPNLVVKRDGKTVENGSLVYADIAACGGDPATDPGSTYTFSVTYPSNVPVVELWLGVEQDCSQTTARINQTNGTLPPLCKRLAVDTSNSRTPVLTVNGKSLFQRYEPTDGSDPACDAVRGSPKYVVYLLPLSAESSATVAQPVQVVGTISTLKASFSPFTRRPEAPSSVSVVNGENRLAVSFKAPSSSVPLTKYRAYFDTNKGSGGGTPTDAGGGTVDAGESDAGAADAAAADAGAAGGEDAGANGDAGSAADAATDAGTADAATDDGTDSDTDTDDGTDTGDSTTVACGSGVLVEGALPPVNVAGVVRTGASDSKSAALTDLADVEIDQMVAVAVVAIDPAGNESRLSTPKCVTRKQTNGFLDECEAANEGDCGLESCSLDPTNKGSAISIALLALALTALIRRRGRA